MKSIFAGFLFLVSLSHLNAQSPDTRKLDSLFNVLQDHALATGSVAIAVKGKIIYQRAIGFARLDGDQKIVPDGNTKYRIGSVSKMFTAAMIFQLVDEGKLKLGEKLAGYFPQLPNADKITIENMLYHRSGLHDYTRDTNFPAWKDKTKTQDDMLALIAAKGVDFEPGARADYCNTNYLLLSYIIEKICRMPYATALGKRIISKAGLKNTYYGKSVNIHRKESFSYKYADGAWLQETETEVNNHSGAGAIVSTPADLVIFIQKLFSGKIISTTSLNKMQKIVDGYGMGMFPYDFHRTKGYGHNGRIEEFYAAVRCYPEKNLAVSYITNGILYPRVDILDGILKICFNIDYTIPFSKSLRLEDSELDQYTGEYSSGDLPFKVICKKENNALTFEVAGKSMRVSPVNTHYFMDAKSGSFFEFNPEKETLQIKETDNIYYLKKNN